MQNPDAYKDRYSSGKGKEAELKKHTNFYCSKCQNMHWYPIQGQKDNCPRCGHIMQILKRRSLSSILYGMYFCLECGVMHSRLKQKWEYPCAICGGKSVIWRAGIDHFHIPFRMIVEEEIYKDQIEVAIILDGYMIVSQKIFSAKFGQSADYSAWINQLREKYQLRRREVQFRTRVHEKIFD